MQVEFDNVAISVTDVDRAADWYCDLLGFQTGYRTRLDELDADFMVLERDDVRLELVSQAGCQRHEDAEVQPPNHLKKSNIMAVVFRTDDLDSTTTDLEHKGAAFVWKKQVLSEDGLKSTMLRDPDGNFVNVLCYPK